MIIMQFKLVSQKEMSLVHKRMHHNHKFQIMSGVVNIMVFEFLGLISNRSTILHQHCTHTFQRSICANYEITYKIRHYKD